MRDDNRGRAFGSPAPHPALGEQLSYVVERQVLWAPYFNDDDKQQGWALCVCKVGAGFSALVWNAKHNYKSWVHVRDCYAFIGTDEEIAKIRQRNGVES